MLTDVVNPPPPPTAVTPKRPPLYRYGADLAALDDLLYEVGGDVTDPTVCAAVTAWLDELHVGEAQKLDDCHAYLRHLEMERDAARHDAMASKQKADSRQDRIDAFKASLKTHLTRRGVAKLVSGRGVSFALVANGGVAPLLVPDPDRVPVEFLKTVVVADSEKIRAALAAGEALDFASLGERGSHLRVKA